MTSRLRMVVWMVAAVSFVPAGRAEGGGDLLSIDHYVRHASTVPAVAGQTVQLYVRERVRAGVLARSPSFEERVVLFVHGAGTPAEVAFDVPYPGYSWMAYLAAAGYDVFAMDVTGYGRSTRPAAMNDPCNVGAERQAALMPAPLASTCEQSYPGELTTIASEWDDIDAVVEYLRALRRVERVSLIGWSRGGPRAGGYAARHPRKVARLVLLAPAYTRDMPAEAPALPVPGAAMNVQSYADFTANWDRQVGCEDQYDPAVRDRIWTEMLASDPVGASWGPGVRRAPNTTVWGWNRDVVGRTQTPMLLVAGVHDEQILPERVRQLYDDLGARQKVLLDLGCSSHAAMWERNRELLFRASLEWLRDGTVEGMTEGVVRLGY